jgi:hypothetical protein
MHCLNLLSFQRRHHATDMPTRLACASDHVRALASALASPGRLARRTTDSCDDSINLISSFTRFG